MKYEVYVGIENKRSLILETGGDAFGIVTLYREPYFELEAATVGYAGISTSNVSSDNFKTGFLSHWTIPGFVGEVNRTVGSSGLNLSTITTYNDNSVKYDVDSKGRVTASYTLTENDIPRLPWTKISNNQPLTLNEMGITNSVRRSGSVLTGKITVPVPGGSNNSLMSKLQTDILVEYESNKHSPIGMIMETTRNYAPRGYLKANGSILKISDYRDLYDVIGRGLSNIVYSGGGTPWTQQYEIERPYGTSLVNWSTSTPLPMSTSRHEVVVTKNRIYVLAGRDAMRSHSRCYTSAINPNGVIEGWEPIADFPIQVEGFCTFITKNIIYALGGRLNDNLISDKIFRSRIAEDGSLSDWVEVGKLPLPISCFRVVVIKNRVYLFGGEDRYYKYSEIYVSDIDSDGNLSEWRVHGNLPIKVSSHEIALTGQKIHLIGGNSGSQLSRSVYSAPVDSDGVIGVWYKSSDTPTGFEDPTSIVLNDRVYIFGGYNGTGVTLNIYVSTIGPTGGLDGFSNYGRMYTHSYRGKMAITSSRLYLIGGYAGGYMTTVQHCPLDNGLNDYTGFYKYEGIPVEFRLPEYPSKNGFNYYIKYRHL